MLSIHQHRHGCAIKNIGIKYQLKTDYILVLPTRFTRDVTRSLAYPKGTVGSWMESSIAAFRVSSRVSDARRYIRRNQSQTLSHVFFDRRWPSAGRLRCDFELVAR